VGVGAWPLHLRCEYVYVMQAMRRSIRYTTSTQQRLESQPTVTRHCIGLRSGSWHLSIFYYWVSSASVSPFFCFQCSEMILNNSDTKVDCSRAFCSAGKFMKINLKVIMQINEK